MSSFSLRLSGVTEAERLAECVEKIEQLVQSRKRGTIGVAIQTVGGETIYAYHQDELFKPASNLKLITSAVAIEKLGASYRYRTDFFVEGEIRGGTLQGNLIMMGSTDPMLSGYFEKEIHDIIKTWLDTLRHYGIARIEGNLILDNSYYVGNRPLSTEERDVRFATVANFSRASEQQLRKVSRVRVIRTKDGRKRVVRRGFRRRSRLKLVSIEPNVYCATVLHQALQDAGVMPSSSRLEKVSYNRKIDRTRWRHLFSHYSISLTDALKATNKISDNFYADQLLRTLGAEFYGEGSIEKGLAVVSKFLRDELKAQPSTYRLTDGSGLSHENFVTPHLIVETLAYMRTHSSAFREYYESLAIPMTDGTLAGRIHHPLAHQIRAKTGSITGVVSLSGYLKSRSGKEIIFSIIANGLGRRTRQAKALEDAICKLLLEI
ncbi:MAG: D-alanyl-D-alanine carboxypeptidase/D-alanyl-D-alanine-endopeptidase [Chloroherpetonaceae bacterium]|nr:D-alanyl-D-alanine carboxypeptidase/D-alanyl-D-alanine-endopeptidase [Chloroherpetonaceae bacterium]MCS7212502.1 D-alanyl-D-alanine carboxypeptidase/D-alanyl-D-alanine-endopeptidase [Chloroherpetonaceae bacterium]MDW8018834.1 D-alanyl-D-alanine carboxypeptidase/D-alanyl-D-alanine-endopeptidase [Chloroherpetonaceae bacterium]